MSQEEPLSIFHNWLTWAKHTFHRLDDHTVITGKFHSFWTFQDLAYTLAEYLPPSDILHLALCNKAFHIMFSPLLFRHLTVQPYHLPQIANYIRRNPLLAGQIRAIRVEEVGDKRVSDDLEYLLQAIANQDSRLVSFQCSFSFLPRRIWDALHKCAPTLEHLYAPMHSSSLMENLDGTDDESHVMFHGSDYPALRSLLITSWSDRHTKRRHDILSPLQNLQFLTIVQLNENEGPLALDWTIPTLRYLDGPLASFRGLDARGFLERHPSLERLTLAGWFSSEAEHTAWIDSNLPIPPQLRAVSLPRPNAFMTSHESPSLVILRLMQYYGLGSRPFGLLGRSLRCVEGAFHLFRSWEFLRELPVLEELAIQAISTELQARIVPDYLASIFNERDNSGRHACPRLAVIRIESASWTQPEGIPKEILKQFPRPPSSLEYVTWECRGPRHVYRVDGNQHGARSSWRFVECEVVKQVDIGRARVIRDGRMDRDTVWTDRTVIDFLSV